MTYFNTITHALDLIGNETFKNDEINIKLNSNTCYFIRYVLQEYDWIPTTFERIYDPIIRDEVGLKLKKTELNSSEDKVKPEFLETIKKAAKAYLVALASNWKICSEIEIDDIKKDQCDEEVSKETIMIKQKFAHKLWAAYRVIQQIMDTWEFQDKIKICTYADAGDYIYGKKGDMNHLLEILRNEALGSTEIPLPLSSIICRQISLDLPTYQTQEKYKYLPNEFIEKINTEAVFTLKY